MNKDLKDVSILMISLDAGLLANTGSGDVIERHRKYASFLARLDILVLSGPKSRSIDLADNLMVFGCGKGLFAIWRAYFVAKQLFKKYNYDLIDVQDPHLTGLLGFFLKRKFNKKLEIHFHGDFWHNKFWLKESWKNKIFYILQKFITPRADAIRVVNSSIADTLIKDGIEKDLIRVINTPVNEKVFTQEIDIAIVDQIKKEYNHKKILVFAGRLVSAKNLLFFLGVIKKLLHTRNDFIVLLIGDGEDKKNILDFIAHNNLSNNIFLLEPQKHETLAKYYKSAYLNILLSTNESFGKVIIEAGFSSLATLASASLGPVRIIKNDYNGFLVPINDFEATYFKLNFLLDNDELVKKVAKKAKEDFMQTYSQNTSYKKVQDFWLDIINN